MCLTPMHPKPFIAEKDILCKKCLIKLDNDLYTPYQNVPITFNKGTCIQIAYYGFNFDEYGNIRQGIHSYSKLCTKGLASDLIYLCIIPKGIQYYIGKYDDLVSLKLIIFKNRFRYWIYKIFHK